MPRWRTGVRSAAAWTRAHTPIVHALVRQMYERGRRVQAQVGGSALQERLWATRHLHAGSDWGAPQGPAHDDWVAGYWASKDHPHRSLLADAVASWAPASVFEVGCNCGPNLVVLASRLPGASLAGIDINPEAIARGRQLVAAAGLSHIALRQGSTDTLAGIATASIDVVYTDACLIYIAPDRIMAVLEHLVRIARKACVLVECHGPAEDTGDPVLGRYDDGCWRRDYERLLRRCARPPRQVTIRKIPEAAWPVEPWRQWGYLVEAAL